MQAEQVSADALTACLRTTNNALSSWYCTLDDQSVTEAALAIAAGRERLDKLHVVALSKEELAERGVKFQETEGGTPVHDLRKRHVDMIELTAGELVVIAEAIACKSRNDTDCYDFTMAQVRGLILEAINRGRVELEHLDEKLRAAMAKELSAGA